MKHLTRWGRPELRVIAGGAAATILAAVTIGGLGASGAEARYQACEPQVIDVFDDTTDPLEATAADPSVARADGPLTGVVGGERDMTITRTAPDPPLLGTAALSVASGFITWSNGVNVVSEGSLTWDGPDGDATTLDPEGLGGIDYSGAGDAGVFSFEITAWDIAVEAPFTLEVYTDAGAASTQTVTPTPVPVPAGTLVEFPISGFTPLAGAGADFGNVGAIVLQFAASDQALDMAFDGFMGPCASEVVQPPVTTAPSPPPPSPAPAVVVRPTFTG